MFTFIESSIFEIDPVYAKARHDKIPAHILKALKERFSDETKDQSRHD
jgi:hypothetical protein